MLYFIDQQTNTWRTQHAPRRNIINRNGEYEIIINREPAELYGHMIFSLSLPPYLAQSQLDAMKAPLEVGVIPTE